MNITIGPVRAMLLAAVLAFAVHVSDARAMNQTPSLIATATTARTNHDAEPAGHDATPVGGILIIVGIVGGLVLLAWVCSRINDSRPTMS